VASFQQNLEGSTGPATVPIHVKAPPQGDWHTMLSTVCIRQYIHNFSTSHIIVINLKHCHLFKKYHFYFLGGSSDPPDPPIDATAYLAGRSLCFVRVCLPYLAGLYYQRRYGPIHLLPIATINDWMTASRLQLNPAKSQVLWFCCKYGRSNKFVKQIINDI